MHIDWATLALETINLVILIALLSRFLFRPVADLLAQRSAEAAKLLDDAEAERAAAVKARAGLDQEAARLAQSRAEAMRAAAEAAEAERRKLVAAAESKAEEIVAAARAAAAAARAAEAALSERRAAELALEIAARVLARLPREASAASFLAGLAAEAAALPASVRAEMAAQPLTLASAVELDAATQAAARKSLAGALGGEIALSFVVDSSLIAGLQLDGPHVRVRNHLRGDLDRIAQEFASHAA